MPLLDQLKSFSPGTAIRPGRRPGKVGFSKAAV